MNYQETEQYLLAIPGYTKKNTMENTDAYMRYLSDHAGKFCRSAATPFEDMPNVIHVAGTNGKGSVCAFLSGILTQAGYKVGMFTSPHLIKMTERFQINGMPVTEEKFASACTFVREQVKQGIKGRIFTHPTFFEFLVGVAFVLAQIEQVDILILETGLGGLKDATNFVKKPLATVITTIGLDHTEFLGNTIEEIAVQKAGIIKSHVPVIYDGTNPAVKGIIVQKAEQLQAKSYEVAMKLYEILHFGKKSIDFLWKSEYYNDMRIHLETSAVYQVLNAAMAALTIEIIDKEHRITGADIAQGIRKTRWQGRMEWLGEHVLVDGAHNENGMEQALFTLEKMHYRVILVYSAVQDKNYKSIIRMLCEQLNMECVVVTQLDTPRAVVTEELAEIFRCHFAGDVHETDCVEDAVELAQDRWQELRGTENRTDGTEIVRDRDTIIFGTGSLYLVGAWKKYWNRRESDETAAF